MFDINKQKIKFCILLELVHCYFDLIFVQQVEMISVDHFKNSEVLRMCEN